MKEENEETMDEETSEEENSEEESEDSEEASDDSGDSEEASDEETSTEESQEEASEEGKDKFGRELHKAKCSDCGKETDVPFKPDGSRPVYCRDCYRNHRKPRRDRQRY